MTRTDRPTEDAALARCKNLTAEDIIENIRKAKESEEAKMELRIGNFGNMGTRRGDSAEARALRNMPLTRDEIADHTIGGTTVTFSTKSGREVSMSVAAARLQGLVGTGR